MLGDKIKIHARLVGEFENLQMALVEIDIGARRLVVLLHVVEQSEFHVDDSYFAARMLLFNFLEQRVVVHFFQREFFYLRAALGAKIDDGSQSRQRNIGNAQRIILHVLFVRRVEGFAVGGAGVFADRFLGQRRLPDRQIIGGDGGAQNSL